MVRFRVVSSKQIATGPCPRGHRFCFSARCWTVTKDDLEMEKLATALRVEAQRMLKMAREIERRFP